MKVSRACQQFQPSNWQQLFPLFHYIYIQIIFHILRSWQESTFSIELPFQLKGISFTLFHRYSTFFSHTLQQPRHTRHNFLDMLLLFSIFLHVHVCLFFQAQELPTLFRSITIPSKTFSSQADNSFFFQLTRICFLYSMAFQHFLVILINNLVGQTTVKFNL